MKAHTSLTIESVKTLADELIHVADLYPLNFRTERDFFPLVYAILRRLVPSVEPEADVDDGLIDFRTGGKNPAFLELVVAPRAISDLKAPSLRFPGHGKAVQLYASQNRTELVKLLAIPQSQAKNRYLLLIDFMDAHDEEALRSGYRKAAGALTCVRPVRVIYASRARSFDFSIP